MKGNEGGTTVAQHTNNADDSVLEKNITRRRMMQATGAAAATAVAAGATGPAAASHGPSLDFGSSWIDDPYINGSVQVDVTEADMAELEYVADDDTITSLVEHGIVLATEDDADTPHNPVSLMASKIKAPEFEDFPRGITYDHDSDTSTDEEEVSVLDATHWTTDVSGSAGTMSVSNPNDGELRISTSSQTSGDTAIATFDLSTVGSDDATITEGMSRKFLQKIVDVDTLESGVIVEYAIVDSNGTEVTVTIDPSGDTSTVSVASASTGDSQVLQTRAGELETDQSVELSDIQLLKVRVKDANADVTHHGLNLERADEWELGTQEQNDGDGGVEDVTLTEPSGSYSIKSITTLPSWATNADILDVTYSVEMRASELPDDQRHVRSVDAPESYDRPIELEYVFEYEWPSAYALETVTASDLRDEVAVASSRYLAVDVATGISDLDDDEDDDTTLWEDVDNVSWTDKSGSMGTVGNDVQLLSSVAAGDRTAARIKVNLDEEEEDAATTSGSGAVGAVDGGGGGGGMLKWVLGGVLGVGVVFRRNIMSFLGR